MMRKLEGLSNRSRLLAGITASALCAVLVVLVVVSAPATMPVFSRAANGGESTVAVPANEGSQAGSGAGGNGFESTRSDATGASAEQSAAADASEAFEPGVVLATLASGATPESAGEALSRALGQPIVSSAEVVEGLVSFKLPEGVGVQDAVRAASTVAAIDAAQPNYCYQIASDAPLSAQVSGGVSSQAANGAAVQAVSGAPSQTTSGATVQATSGAAALSAALPSSDLLAQSAPNDPYYSSQWYLSSMNAQDAWDTVNAAGAESVTVAVIDSGFLVNHVDLRANVATSYNAVTKQEGIAADYSRKGQMDHGTHCAGLVAAVSNNGNGIAGVTNNTCKVLPVRVRDSEGHMYSSYLASAYDYLVSHKDTYHIRVANVSLGLSTSSLPNRATDPIIYDAIQKGVDAGIVTTAAACNEDAGTPPFYAFPSDFDNVVSVISLQQTETDEVERGERSNYNVNGQKAKNISAPGVDIVSLIGQTNTGMDAYKGTMYATMSGTSMAAPITSGVLGLMIAANPGLTPSEAASKLYSTATDVVTGAKAKRGWDVATGFGEVNAASAVAASSPYLSGAVKVQVGKKKTLSVKIAGKKKVASNWTWKSSDETIATVNAKGVVVGKKGGQVIITATKGSLKAKQIVTVQVPASKLAIELRKTSFTYAGKARTPVPVVRYNGKKLTLNKDYTRRYLKNANAGTATVVVRGVAPYFVGKAKQTFSIEKAPLSKANIVLSSTNLSYNGTPQKPTVAVYDIGKNKAVKLTEGVNYTVSGAGVTQGSGSITVTALSACANFTGSVTKTFTVG